MNNGDCTVLVCSCDKYVDLLSPFSFLWRKFWPDCPFSVAIVSETPPNEGDLCFDRVIATGFGLNWSQMLVRALEEISTPYVLMLMNDYFLNGQVDTERVLMRLGQARRFDAANLRMNPNPHGRMPWQDTDLMEMPKDVAYCVTCQAGIWNREFLLGVARRSKSAWEFERYGSFMVGDEKRPLLVTPTKEFPFVDAVHKGYWEKFGLAVCRANGAPVDTAARTLPPLKVRIIEGMKAIVFRIVPTTLLVRVQNKFALGAKERKK